MAITRILLFSTLPCCVLTVIVIPLTLNLPKPYESDIPPVNSLADLLIQLHAGTTLNKNYQFSNLDNSVYPNKINRTSGIYASHDSFVRGAIDAGAKHQHLAMKPQDVWITILKQMGAYIGKHKDDMEVSEKWDSSKAKARPAFQDWTFASFLDRSITAQFDRSSKTNWLLDWVRPNFGTVPRSQDTFSKNSTEESMSKALMMASSSISSEELAAFPCQNGIPSITLLGTKADWEKLLDKLDPMKRFGKEPAAYGDMLRPILARFVATFDKPNDPDIRSFWSDIVTATIRQQHCNTTDLVTGWINAFHHWDGAGNLVTKSEVASHEAVKLDGITYPWRHRKDLPTSYSHMGYCVMVDTLRSWDSDLLMGMLATSVKKGIPNDYAEAMQSVGFKLPSTVVENDHSILQPLIVWIGHGTDHKVLFLFPCILSSSELITFPRPGSPVCLRSQERCVFRRK
jgi:hypothetical protein